MTAAKAMPLRRLGLALLLAAGVLFGWVAAAVATAGYAYDKPTQLVATTRAAGPVARTATTRPDKAHADTQQARSCLRALPVLDSGSFLAAKPAGSYRPDRALPRTKHGDPIPDSPYPHTQLGSRTDNGITYTQGREWLMRDGRLRATRDFDFTDHTMPELHPNPHQHRLTPNNPAKDPRGGYQRGSAEEMEMP